MVISSWSGGKDSCLACYKVIEAGHKVDYLLNFISREYKRCCFHGIEVGLLKLQADLTGIPLLQREVSPDMEKYEEEFKGAVSELMQKGARSMVFGDIYLDEHKGWVDRVCRDLGIEPIEPLWGMDTGKIIEEFIDAGFKSIVVSCKADIFGKEFIGRYVDREFLKELKEKEICPCGENGEFHTFVVDGPIFKERRIEITESEAVLKKGFWEYWFLDIKKYKTIGKTHIGRGNEGAIPSAAPQR
ncbi:MAG: diphthine--ammonia ligase [Candidatus Omnitrophica bacterium]|nr:diphthine--ammonia ligase [Candidatus Omnitrophota bacterium]